MTETRAKTPEELALLGRHVSSRVEWILKAAGAVAKQARTQIEEIAIHHKVSEPGYDMPECGLVATGNWNAADRYDAQLRRRIDCDNTPQRVERLFEKLGVECEWGDEWTECQDCQGLVRTETDGPGWTRSYADIGGETVCMRCILADPDEYLEGLEGTTEMMTFRRELNLAEHGYKLLEGDYETGLHEGMNASPEKVAHALGKQDVSRFIFQLEDVTMFQADWSVWVHEEEWSKLNVEAFRKENANGPDIAARIKSQLQQSQPAGVVPGKLTISHVGGEQIVHESFTPEQWHNGERGQEWTDQPPEGS